MQNQAPQGFEDGDKVNVELRPESVSLDLRYDGGTDGQQSCTCIQLLV